MMRYADSSRPGSSGLDLTVHRELDGQPGRPYLCEQAVQTFEPRHRVVSRALALAQDAQHAPHVTQRLTARPGDHVERRPRLLRPPVDGTAAATGLDHDHAHVVRDDVVQLARDALSFLDDRPTRPCLPLAFLALRPLLERGRVEPADPRGVTEEPGHAQDELRLDEALERFGTSPRVR